MSLKASTWAWSVRAGGSDGISPCAKLLLVALADFADDAGQCWPSVPRLAAMTGLGARSIRRLLPDLVAAGLVAMDHQSGRNTRYRLHLGNGAEPRSPGQGCHTGRGVNGTPVEMAPHPGPGGTPAPVAPLPMTTETPVLVAPEPLRTTRKEEVPPGRDLPLTERAPAPLPPDWLPSVEGEASALRFGLDLTRTLLKFRGWYVAKRTRLADWDAQWGVWCVWERERLDKATAPRASRDGFAQLMRERMQREGDDFEAEPNPYLAVRYDA